MSTFASGREDVGNEIAHFWGVGHLVIWELYRVQLKFGQATLESLVVIEMGKFGAPDKVVVGDRKETILSAALDKVLKGVKTQVFHLLSARVLVDVAVLANHLKEKDDANRAGDNLFVFLNVVGHKGILTATADGGQTIVGKSLATSKVCGSVKPAVTLILVGRKTVLGRKAMSDLMEQHTVGSLRGVDSREKIREEENDLSTDKGCAWAFRLANCVEETRNGRIVIELNDDVMVGEDVQQRLVNGVVHVNLAFPLCASVPKLFLQGRLILLLTCVGALNALDRGTAAKTDGHGSVEKRSGGGRRTGASPLALTFADFGEKPRRAWL